MSPGLVDKTTAAYARLTRGDEGEYKSRGGVRMLLSESVPSGSPGPSEATVARVPLARVLCLVLALALCYANSLRVPFLLDDPHPGILLDFSRRPVVTATFALNRALSGTETWSFHVLNALVHLGCGLLLYGILRRTLARFGPRLGGAQENLAFVAALLWLCHPLQTSAVTYISQRAEALGAFFYLATLYAFVRAVSSARPGGWYALVLVSLVLGFFTKEIIATAPLTLWLYDGLFLAPGMLAALRLRRGFYAVLGVAALGLGGALIAPLLLAKDATAGFSFAEFGPLEYALTQPGVILHYLRLAFWPHPLVFDYGWPIARGLADVLLPAALLLVLLVGTGLALARRSWLGFAGAWFFLILAPTSSIVPIKDPAFEHRVYLPLAAVLVVAVVGLWWLVARRLRSGRLLPALATLGVLALAATTVRRNHDYRSAIALMQDTVSKAPHHARAYANLGAMLLEEGREEEAVPVLLESTRLDPQAGLPYMSLGLVYMHLGKVDEALSMCEKAVERSKEPRCLDALGQARSMKGDHAGALRCFEQALETSVQPAGIHYRIANTLRALGRREEALQHLRESLRLDPGQEDAHVRMAGVLTELGRLEEALGHSMKALELAPGSPSTNFAAGSCLRAVGRLDEAVATFRASVRLGPGLLEPRVAFAETVLLKPDASAEERREALRLALEAQTMTNAARPDLADLVRRAKRAAGQE